MTIPTIHHLEPDRHCGGGHGCLASNGNGLARSVLLFALCLLSLPLVVRASSLTSDVAIADIETRATAVERTAAELPGEPSLPRVMSTNLCADMLLLGLADPEQIVSLSYHSRNPRRSSLVEVASQFDSNQATAEEVIAYQPDVVLASRRWQAQHQMRLFERLGVRVINVPFPSDWPGIFESLKTVGKSIGRDARAVELIDESKRRLQQVHVPSLPLSALYLRGNGGTAASGTFIDALFQALSVTNQADRYGVTAWGRASLESIVLDPPDAFLLSRTERDTSLARSGVVRHPLLRELLATRPVLSLGRLDTSCSDWRQVETVEKLAVELARRWPESAPRQLP